MAIYAAKGSDTYAALVNAGSGFVRGSWAEILASTAATIAEVRVSPVSSNQTSRYLIDIGTGAGGAEGVLIADVMMGVGTIIRVTNPVLSLPVNIASGTRLSARVLASASSKAIRLSLMLVGGTGAPANPVTYGADTTNVAGVTVDPGGTVDTKGSFAQIVASTSAEHTWICVVISGRGNVTPASAFFAVDIATGAGGAESVQIPDICVASSAGVESFAPTAMAFPLSIASGTRIAARSASSTNDATDRLLDVEVIGGRVASSGGSGSSAEVSHVFVG